MKTKGNTILITGGGTGIGLALAEQFFKAGNDVIICGRREERLREAKTRLPGIQYIVGDVSTISGRESLYKEVISKYPSLNILVNNAGIQRMVDLKQGITTLLETDSEIETNLTAVIHLSAWFIPHFMKKNEAAIFNVSSGLGFIPLSIMPVYCATKAALHSYSLSLRYQLRKSPVKVFEVIPPIVDTELDKGERDKRGQRYRGIPPEEVAAEVLKAMEKDEFECAIGQAVNLVQGSRHDPDQFFRNLNP